MPAILANRAIHDEVDEFERILADKSQEEFVSDKVLRLSLGRLLEIISDASRHLPRDVAAETTIFWGRLEELGDWLRRDYYRIDPDILWRIAQEDLPVLKAFVARVIREAQA